MAEEERIGCQHEDKSSICYRCENQYTCPNAQDPDVIKTTECAPHPGISPGFKEMGK